MIGLAPMGRIFLRRLPTDMRKSFDGLTGLVRGELGQDPLTGDLFVFVNRRRDFVKALYWDRDGLALWAKRLARGRFALAPDGPQEIGREDLSLLLEGVRARVLSRSPRWHPKANKSHNFLEIDGYFCEYRCIEAMHATPSIEASTLTADPAVLVRMVVEQAAIIARMEQALANLRHEKDEVAQLLAEQIKALKSQIDWLNQQLFGRKSEKVDPNQMCFDALVINAMEQSLPAVPSEAAAAESKGQERKRHHTPHGRGELPAHLPREILTVDAPDAEKFLPDGTPRPLIGHEDTERIAYEPGRIYVKVTRRLKYGSPMGQEENGVIIAPVPETLVPKCIADESLMAHLIVSKFEDHLPLNRQEHILERSGIDLSRQTMCDVKLACGVAVQPLIDAMVREMFLTKLVHNDDTPVDMQDYKVGKPRGKQTRETRLWVTTVAPREGPWTIFDFTNGRSTDGPRKFFATYAGRIVCDAYTSYDILGRERDDLILIGCWAHVRRYFLKAHHGGYPREGAEFIAMIRELYQVEQSLVDTVLPPEATPAQRVEARNRDNARRLEVRQSLAVPVLYGRA